MKCSYCGKEIKSGHGIIFAKDTKQVLYFCSKKCRINSQYRKPQKTKWTEKAREMREERKRLIKKVDTDNMKKE
ncbi:MAG: 50S ribosomal protein L24 [Candidatus Huberarchaeum crystalense]|uniref:50S ribosomal protein L24e n=1 Tax=Huberarchaeum crystalense TaxID=2014257 RepID=A0A2G9LJC9_HUBC1|nr:TRASH domain-containing protein [archaeon]OIP20247.1 MAG: hypothetical protein AUJ91_01825 [archaeon CG2_30_31_98]PIN66653.1 MAG: 50S ribosomal protein L24 [Candidatus Huberarchaeum crystalense]NCS98263.1 TRASH domain-containing protein [archaeon]PIV13745.1 MAG: 50S ribosomal protein L24 [Candidatus Huberarchaeum crystalense]